MATSSAESRPIRFVVASSLFWVAAGCSWVLLRWWPRDPALALRRVLLCGLLIGVLHWIGYCVFARQRELAIPEDLKRLLRINVAIQACMLALSTTLLDGGHVLALVGIAAIGYWTLVAMVLARRGPQVTSLDRGLLAAGFLLVAGAVAPLVIAVAWVLRLMR